LSFSVIPQFFWLACFLHDSYSCADKDKFRISFECVISNSPSTFKPCTTMSHGYYFPASPASSTSSISLAGHNESNLGAFLGDQFAAGSDSLAAPLQMEMATLDNTLDSSQEVLMVPGPDVGECVVFGFCCCLFVCLFLCCSLMNPPPLSVLDDDLYTADDKLHLQEIATNFQKLFPPHPAIVPEAYLFASKKEFAQRVNSAASKFGFVISNSSSNKFCCSRANAEAA
jgi:hypothetical protein